MENTKYFNYIIKQMFNDDRIPWLETKIRNKKLTNKLTIPLY